MDNNFAVEMNHITKQFGSNKALDDVTLKVRKGTIHALLGENGAGKTTLMNVLYGVLDADEGEIFINGENKEIKNPRTAINLGIGMVHQHFMLVENFTVTQNIILGEEKTKLFGIIDKKKVRKDISELSERYGLDIDPDAKIEDISVGMQQRVEILKALYRGAEILILDEPTAVLTPQEIDELIDIIRKLTQSGKTIIIITHKLKEIMKSADICTIICRGKYIDTVTVSDTSEQILAEKMAGRKVNLVVNKHQANPSETVFEINNLHVNDTRGIERVKGLSLSVKKGEIVGIAGIDGNGQKELIEAITNLCRSQSGEILVCGKNVANATPKFSIDSGINTIHEDRHKRGLVLDFTIAENSIIENYYKQPFSRCGILNESACEEYACKLIREFDVRPDNCSQHPASSLSGGNQQKVVIAREIGNDPEILIAVQPTRGLDVGAIEFVHKKLVEHRDSGKAVLLISFELDEVINLSDRICVLYDGRIVEEMPSAGADERYIGLLMAGGDRK